jgi:hypothetical protein
MVEMTGETGRDVYRFGPEVPHLPDLPAQNPCGSALLVSNLEPLVVTGPEYQIPELGSERLRAFINGEEVHPLHWGQKIAWDALHDQVVLSGRRGGKSFTYEALVEAYGLLLEPNPPEPYNPDP